MGQWPIGFMECPKPCVFFWAEASDPHLGEGVCPRRSRIRNVSRIRIVSRFLGIGAEVLFIVISSGVLLCYWQRLKGEGGTRWGMG